CFFFSSRRRHTRFSRDWSSDVCSSDLGFVGFERHRRALADADVLVIGEGHEWEVGQYVTDAALLGLGKGLVVIGHAPSEAAGMDACARWLRTFIDVPVEFVGVPDPYAPVR